MKKILLLAAASVAALAANAAGFNGNLTASYHGETISNGDVVKISDYEDFEIVVPGMGYQYAIDVVVTNLTSNNIATSFKASYTDHPTQAMAEADSEAWGGLQLCYFGAVEGSNCLQELDVERTVPANSSMTWQFDNTGVSPTRQEKDRKYHIVLGAEGTTLSFDVIFNPDDTAVDEIGYDNTEAVYYNLQGQRVVNPEKGLYIVKQNGKTQKMMVR